MRPEWEAKSELNEDLGNAISQKYIIWLYMIIYDLEGNKFLN